MHRSALSLAALSLVAGAATALAADLPSRKGAPATPVPVASACADGEAIPTDAFGFTTGSDVAKPGDAGASLTYGGAYGTRAGRLRSHGLQAQASFGVLPCLEMGPYLLGNLTDATSGGAPADSRSLGAGVEVKYRLLGRDLHGIGLTAVIDPSFNRVDPDGAGRFSAYNTGLRLFIDRTLIPRTLYAAINLSHDLSWTGPSPYLRSSVFTVAGSLAWQAVKDVYISAEIRHQRAYGTLGFGKERGHATFAGPGIYWQASENLTLSAAYNIQIAGKAKGQPGDLDLGNFSQHLVKVKAAYSF